MPQTDGGFARSCRAANEPEVSGTVSQPAAMAAGWVTSPTAGQLSRFRGNRSLASPLIPPGERDNSPIQSQEPTLSAASEQGTARNQTAANLRRRMLACQSAGDGDGYQSARTSLYEMFESLSFSIVSHLLSQSWLSPEDILQECRVATLQAIDRWEPERGELPILLTYFTRARVREYLRNRELIRRSHSAFDRHGQAMRQGRDTEETAAIKVYSFSAPDTKDRGREIPDLLEFMAADPDEPYDRIQLQIAIAQALDYLQPEDRQSIILHFGLNGTESHTYRDMAPLIGATYQTAKNRVDRALPVLAAVLEGAL